MRLYLRRISSMMLLAFLLSGSVIAQDNDSDTENSQPTPSPLVVWLPDTLVVSSRPNALPTLRQQTNEFAASDEVQVNFRVKRYSDEAGGLMPTLRTASPVAPGALPDVTLLTRRDLVTAQQVGLIQPLEGMVLSAVIDDLDTALPLGHINGALYGIPYLLELQHVMYRLEEDEEPIDSWTFEDFLSRRQTMFFPGSRSTGVSEVFFLQYISAGGTLPREGTMTLNENALNRTLAFYQEAVEDRLIDESVLAFSRPQDYMDSFNDGVIDIAVTGSTTYLRMHAQDNRLVAAPIPTENGQTITTLDGWVWVLVASNPDRQALAVRYLNWMMDAEHQSEYAQAIAMLPSQRSAQQLSLSEPAYSNLVNNMLGNAILPLTDSNGGTLARAMQNALIAVLNGDQTADEATQGLVDQLPQ